MYRITLTDDQRHDLQRRTRAPGLSASTRGRLEMVRLSDTGWSIPQIARHFDQHDQTVRFWIKAFLAGGFDALVNQPRGGKASALTPTMPAALHTEIVTSQRTWTARQVADWLIDHYGLRLSTGRLRVHLKRAKLSYHRTSRSLKHKQKPDEVAQGAARLDRLEKKARPV